MNDDIRGRLDLELPDEDVLDGDPDNVDDPNAPQDPDADQLEDDTAKNDEEDGVLDEQTLRWESSEPEVVLDAVVLDDEDEVN